MSWRRAGPGDAPGLRAHLSAHLDSSMFPLVNLGEHGLEGSTHPRALRVWIWGDPIEAALCVTNEGMIMPQIPDLTHPGWPELPDLLGALTPIGLLGAASQVRRVIALCGYENRPTQTDEDEPHYALDLTRLHLPAHDGLRLAMPRPEDQTLLLAWRVHYHSEVLGTPPERAEPLAAAEIDTYLKRGRHRLLWRGDTPVAFAGLNAALPDIVQIGGVYTPPDLRGQGFARTAVALLLEDCRAQGVRRAVLFAASPAAQRAYEAIGFERIGAYALVLFRSFSEGRR